MTEKRRAFIINFIYALIVIGLVYLIFKYGVPVISPFLLAFIFAFLLKWPIRLLNEKCKLPRKLSAVIMVLLLFALFIFLGSLLGVKLFTWLKQTAAGLPDWYRTVLEPALKDTFASLSASLNSANPSFGSALSNISDNMVSSIGKSVSEMSVTLLSRLSSVAYSVPALFVRVIITIISTFFIAIDYKLVTRFILRVLPERARELTLDIKNFVVNRLLRIIRSYIYIMCITFCELTIGFLILGIENPFLYAALIAIVDILPVLGTGGVLIPWAVISVMTGNFAFAAGILVLYIVITIIRNIIEPKIVGDQIGLHPIIMLMSMVVGTRLFGVLGLFGLPITLALLKDLSDKGKINLRFLKQSSTNKE